MGIDFLGRKQEPQPKSKSPVEMHVPEEQEKEESRRSKKKKEEKKKKAEEKKKKKQDVKRQEMEELAQPIDLAEKIRKKRALQKILLTIGIVLLVLGGGSFGVYRLALYLQQQPEEPQQPTQPQQPQQPQQPTQPQEPEEPQQPTQPQEPQELPDTELAPLSGALITFSGTNDIFLIENNGELRLVNQETTVFENGQHISDISRRLIYVLPQRWQDIRKGEQMVQGQVDFDPRVLTLPELQPYL